MDDRIQTIKHWWYNTKMGDIIQTNTHCDTIQTITHSDTIHRLCWRVHVYADNGIFYLSCLITVFNTCPRYFKNESKIKSAVAAQRSMCTYTVNVYSSFVNYVFKVIISVFVLFQVKTRLVPFISTRCPPTLSLSSHQEPFMCRSRVT